MSNGDIIQRWVDVKLGKETRLLNSRASNVTAKEDTVWSYGSPLVYKVEDLWLLNGDRYSVSTSRHQGMIRNAITHSLSGEMLILPFSVLAEARVNLKSIKPVVIQEDTWVSTNHSSDNFDDVPAIWRGGQYHYIDKTLKDPPYKWTTTEHILGESVFTATVEAVDKYHRPVTREGVVFLSGFDHGEAIGRHYFLCELPCYNYTAPDTIEKAYEMLRPPRVKKAEGDGWNIVRQGDVFAIETSIKETDIGLSKMGFKIARRGDRSGFRFDGSHAATRVARDEKGQVLVRGCLYHDPVGFRAPEHSRKKLGDGKTWYEFTTNTVPHDVGFGRRAWSVVSNGMSVD